MVAPLDTLRRDADTSDMDEPGPSVPWAGVIAPDGQVATDDRQHEPSTEDPTWTFARAGDELMLVRPKPSHGLLLVVTMNGSSRRFTFPSETATEKFKADMETFLLNTGWSFVGFMPDRRGRRDRRTFPRPIERRRWWTDGWLFFS
jgi:hypothetical protein